jgi:hypothetical protein
MVPAVAATTVTGNGASACNTRGSKRPALNCRA